jgi:hypothetical protein
MSASTIAIWRTVLTLPHDHHRHPGLDPVERDERDERAGDQQLVGQRVHQLSEVGLALVAAGEPAVDRIGEAREDEHAGRQRVARELRQEQSDEHRDQQDPDDRQDVRDIELEQAREAIRG